MLRVAAVVAVLIALANAQTVTFVMSNYCPISLIAKCRQCQGFDCTVACPQEFPDTVMGPGSTLTWANMSDLFYGRIQGHPILSGLANNTYWDSLTEWDFRQSGIFAGGAFFDLSYVDIFVIPTVIVPALSTCSPVGCNITYSQSLGKCPKGVDYDLTHFTGVGCTNPASYCDNSANKAKSICHYLDKQIQTCATTEPYKSAGCSLLATNNITTQNTYAGTPGFSWGSQYATEAGKNYNAALNRGILSSVGNGTISNWYNLYDPVDCSPQFNVYAKMVRDLCWGTIPTVTGYPYGFSNDDLQNNGAATFCKTRVYNIVWCPADAPFVTATQPPRTAQPNSCSPTSTSAAAATTTTSAATAAAAAASSTTASAAASAASTTAVVSVTAAGGSASAATTAGTTASAAATSTVAATTAAATAGTSSAANLQVVTALLFALIGALLIA